MSLDRWRKRLNFIDASILENICSRDKIVYEIARSKLENKQYSLENNECGSLSAFDIVRPDREKDVLSGMIFTDNSPCAGGALVYEIWRQLIARAYKEQGLKTIRIMGSGKNEIDELNRVALIHYGVQMIYQERVTKKLTFIGSPLVLGIFGVKNLLNKLNNQAECWWQDIWDDEKRMFVVDCLPQVRVNYSHRQNDTGNIAWSWGVDQESMKGQLSRDIAPYWLVTDFNSYDRSRQGFSYLERMIMAVVCRRRQLQGVIERVEAGGGILLSKFIGQSENEGESYEHALFLLSYDMLGELTMNCRDLESSFINKWGEEGLDARLLGGYSLPIDIDEDSFFGFY